MHPVAVRIIKDEHLAISAVLYSLRFVVRKLRDQKEMPNFRLLHAMLDYIVEYPDRWHHPKEDQWLFQALRQHSPQVAPLIDELQAEHVENDRLIEELQQSLIRYETVGAEELPAFGHAVETYAQFHWNHMRKEEEVLIPVAEKSLTETDWQRIGAAFEQNDNPLFGIRPKEQSALLFQRILTLAPPPIGLGDQRRR